MANRKKAPTLFKRGEWYAANFRSWPRSHPDIDARVTLRDPDAEGWPKPKCGRRTKDEGEAKAWRWAYVEGGEEHYRAERARYEARKAAAGPAPGPPPAAQDVGETPAGDSNHDEGRGVEVDSEDPRRTTVPRNRREVHRLKPKDVRPFVIRWREVLASSEGPRQTVRILLLALSTYMKSDGSCGPDPRDHPSLWTLAAAADMSKSTVQVCLNEAEQGGWLHRCNGRNPDGGWRPNHYQATLPPTIQQREQELAQTHDRVPGGVDREPAKVDREPAKGLAAYRPRVGRQTSKGRPGGGPEVVATEQEQRQKQLLDGATAVTPSASENGKKPKPGTDDDPDFQRFKASYPKRAGGQRWKQAGGHWRARLKEGWTPEAMVEAAGRYRNYAEGTGRANSEYVKQAATFLNDQECLESDWDLPEAPRGFSREAARPQEPEDYGEATTEMPAWR